MIFLPTNHTNLHEFIALHYNGDLFGRTNFHEFNQFNHIIRVIRATEQVAF